MPRNHPPIPISTRLSSGSIECQITGLALQIGLIFSGALIMEVVFGYPGMGTLTFQAVLANDYSLIMGITILSIVGVATMVLILDLIYPLFDPRVRYQ